MKKLISIVLCLALTFTLAMPVFAAGANNTVAAGADHSLVINKDGTLWASGWNYYGELGDGTKTQRSKPVKSWTA